MREAGLWLTRAQQRRFHQLRPRREHFGELVQIDGSEHRWFGPDHAACTLLVFIDDATGRLTVFRITKPDAVGGQGIRQSIRALAELTIEILCANSSQAGSHRLPAQVAPLNDLRSGHGIHMFWALLSRRQCTCASLRLAKGRPQHANHVTDCSSSFTIFHSKINASLKVLRDYQHRKLPNSRGNGVRLLDFISTIAVFANHLPKPPHLTFNAAQTIE